MQDTCLELIRFMADLLDFETIKTRIEACLVVEPTMRKQGVRHGTKRLAKRESPRSGQAL